MPVKTRAELEDQLSNLRVENALLRASRQKDEGEFSPFERRISLSDGKGALEQALAALSALGPEHPYLRQLREEQAQIERAWEIASARNDPVDEALCERILLPLFQPVRPYDPWLAFPVVEVQTAAFLAFEAYRSERLREIATRLDLIPILPVPLRDRFDPELHEDAPIHRRPAPEGQPELARRVAKVLRWGFSSLGRVVLRARVVRYLDVV